MDQVTPVNYITAQIQDSKTHYLQQNRLTKD